MVADSIFLLKKKKALIENLFYDRKNRRHSRQCQRGWSFHDLDFRRSFLNRIIVNLANISKEILHQITSLFLQTVLSAT